MSRHLTEVPKPEASSPSEAEKVRDAARLTTESLLAHVGGIVDSCKAVALFIYTDALENPVPELNLPAEVKMFCVTRDPAQVSEATAACVQRLRIPDVPLTRMGQVKIAVFLALSRGWIKRGDRIVFLSGVATTKALDTLIVTEVGREYEILTSSSDLQETLPDILPEVIERVVDIASELGSEGREGRPVGAMFVVGDADRVISTTRQLILNPFRGYSPQERNILDYSLEETVKELATIDGAFVIRGDGVIETCGAYIWAAVQETAELPRGLGARHHAAAAITAVTHSIAIAVSESTGSVTIFQGGRIVTEIQKPRSTAEKPSLLRTRPNDAVVDDSTR
jgi:diadenylate cyclase